jgi:hypothetical protein
LEAPRVEIKDGGDEKPGEDEEDVHAGESAGDHVRKDAQWPPGLKRIVEVEQQNGENRDAAHAVQFRNVVPLGLPLCHSSLRAGDGSCHREMIVTSVWAGASRQDSCRED